MCGGISHTRYTLSKALTTVLSLYIEREPAPEKERGPKAPRHLPRRADRLRSGHTNARELGSDVWGLLIFIHVILYVILHLVGTVDSLSYRQRRSSPASTSKYKASVKDTRRTHERNNNEHTTVHTRHNVTADSDEQHALLQRGNRLVSLPRRLGEGVH
jgi:hypothetical protein